MCVIFAGVLPGWKAHLRTKAVSTGLLARDWRLWDLALCFVLSGASI
jgi:hypothetical protein